MYTYYNIYGKNANSAKEDNIKTSVLTCSLGPVPKAALHYLLCPQGGVLSVRVLHYGKLQK